MIADMAESTPSPPKPPATPRNRRRLWAFRLAAVFLVPLLAFGLLELVLRLAGFGYDTHYFLRLADHKTIVGNPRFGWRFFPPAIARMPGLFTFPAEKKPGAYRIFVLGSSAALGFPDTSYSFARVLEVMLRDRFPKTNFEVINTAMVAINSHALVPIARECLDYQPDLLIVYEGNNEVVGPYGAGTVFGGMSPALWMIRAKLWLKGLKLGQAIESVAARVGSSAQPATEWKGMEFFIDHPVPIDDPRLARVHNYFSDNLRDIAEAARSAKVPLILCTAAVNLADCPPFGSQHRRNLSDAEKKQWQDRYDAGVRMEATNNSVAAISEYLAAAKIDDQFAELHFRLGRCYLASKQIEKARDEFALARDDDTLRFRTDSESNEIARYVAADVPGVRLVDVEKRLDDASRAADDVVGANFFYEHCHLNFEGNYLIAAALFTEIAPLIPGSAVNAAGPGVSPPSIETCSQRLAYTDWDKRSISKAVVALVERPPFTTQLDHASRLAALERESAALQAANTPESLAGARDTYRAAIAAAPDDVQLRRKFAILLGQSGDITAAQDQLRAVIAAAPFDDRARLDLAGADLARGAVRQAVVQYQEILKSPNCDRLCQAETHFNLAVAEERQGHPADALRHYSEAVKLSPRDVKAYTNLGLLLARRGDLPAAIEQHRAVVEIDPSLQIGHFNLGLALAASGNHTDAAVQLREALRLKPNDPAGHLALAESSLELGQADEALAQFQVAVRLAPTSAEARNGLGRALLAKGRRREAIDAFLFALRLKPDFPDARRNLQAARTSDRSP